MNRLLIAAALAAAAAGCATTAENDQLAQADCKIVPMRTGYLSGKSPRPVDPLDQRLAELQLAGSDYRFNQLHRRGMFNNNIEEALRDCDRAAAVR